MKTLILLPFLWLCSSLLFGQNERLVPFTNYANCTHGLKTKSGKLIWRAEFEVLQESRFRSTNYEKPFWLVQRGTKWGMLDPSGKILVPVVYNNVQLGYDLEVFAAFSDSGVVVYNNAGTVVCRIPGCARLQIKKAGLIANDSTGKYGFVSRDFTAVLPMQYDRVSVPEVERWEEGQEEILSERYLLITQDGKQGMYDRRTTQVVVPFKYEWISPHWVTKCAQSPAVFLCQKEGDKKTVFINAEGREVLEGTEIYSEINCIPLDSCGEESVQTLIIRDTNGLRVVNLLTGQKSRVYEHLCAFGGRTVFIDVDEWGVLDTDFSEMKRHHRYAPALTHNLFYYDENDFWQHKISVYELAGRKEVYRLHWEDKVILIYKPNRKKKEENKRNKQENHDYTLIGLFNYETGAVVRPDYGYIRIFQSGGKNVYWAFKDVTDLGEMGSSYKSIDIYDETLQLVKRIKLLLNTDGSGYRDRDLTNRLLIVFNPEKELFGAVNAYGEEIIPVTYSYYKPIEIRDPVSGGKKPEFYVFGMENELGLYTVGGTLLIPHIYSEIGSLGDYLLGKREDKTCVLWNKQGQLLLEGFENPAKGFMPDPTGNCTYESGYGNRDREAYFLRKGKRVYVLSEKGLQLIDSTTFSFSGNYLMIVYNWVLNKQGELVEYNGSKHLTNGNCSLVLDELTDPPAREQSYKPARVDSPKPVRACTWKQIGNASGENTAWQLYDRKGSLRYKEVFDYPVKAEGGSTGIVHSGGKFGVLDTAFNFILPLQYDYIYPCDGYMLYADSSWRWYSARTGRISDAFDAISLEHFGKERLVFKSGKIGVINDSLRMVIPLTDSLQFVKNTDLFKRFNFAGKYGANADYNRYGVVFGGVPENTFRRINNGILVEYSWLHSTANALLKMDPVDKDLMPQTVRVVRFYFNPTELVSIHIPHQQTNGVFSEEIISYSKNYYDDYYTDYRDQRWHKTRELANYLITGGELKRLKLSDILKSDPASQEILDALLLKRLNELQAFGNNCTDIQERIAVMKQHFLISGYSIRFHYPGMYGLAIDLHYSELKTIMKDPTRWKTMTGG